MIDKLKDWGIQVLGVVALVVMEVSKRVRGRWRRSALRERLGRWRGRL